MNCENVAAILDDRAEQKLTSAERCAVDRHLAMCADCARAWRAQETLAAELPPATPPDLLARALRSIAAHPAPASRRYRPRAVAGVVALAFGAALAAITIVTEPWKDADSVQTGRRGTTPMDGPAVGSVAASTDGSAAASAVASLDDPFVFPDGEYFMLLQEPPEYPRDALEQRAEGVVQIRYTIAKDGTVKDAMVVSSTDPRFDTPALLAVERWKYMPRIVDGKRVDVPDISTVIRFQLESPYAVHAPAERDGPELSDLLEPAWQCAGQRDWLCAEQVLDEVSAAYELLSWETQKVLNFYGYLYTQHEDYERAIAAYQQAIEISGKKSREQMTLAHLYFTRQQYQLALDTALEYLVDNERGAFPSAYPFVEKLRQLGIAPTGNAASTPRTSTTPTIDRNDVPRLTDSEYLPTVRVPPEYPPEALAQQLSGWVRLSFTITETGQVTDVKVLASSNPLFEEPAVTAMERWRYTPLVANGTAVARPGVVTTLNFFIEP